MSLDEADLVRDAQIRWQRRIIGLLLAGYVVAAFAAVLGGPAAVQALGAVQALAGVVP